MDRRPSGRHCPALRQPVGGRPESRSLTSHPLNFVVSHSKGRSQMKSEVLELLTEELKDAYSAEKQALRCMQRAVRKASAEALREGIQMHIEQTQVQIERVE